MPSGKTRREYGGQIEETDGGEVARQYGHWQYLLIAQNFRRPLTFLGEGSQVKKMKLAWFFGIVAV